MPDRAGEDGDAYSAPPTWIGWSRSNSTSTGCTRPGSLASPVRGRLVGRDAGLRSVPAEASGGSLVASARAAASRAVREAGRPPPARPRPSASSASSNRSATGYADRRRRTAESGRRPRGNRRGLRRLGPFGHSSLRRMKSRWATPHRRRRRRCAAGQPGVVVLGDGPERPVSFFPVASPMVRCSRACSAGLRRDCVGQSASGRSGQPPERRPAAKIETPLAGSSNGYLGLACKVAAAVQKLREERSVGGEFVGASAAAESEVIRHSTAEYAGTDVPLTLISTCRGEVDGPGERPGVTGQVDTARTRLAVVCRELPPDWGSADPRSESTQDARLTEPVPPCRPPCS